MKSKKNNSKLLKKFDSFLPFMNEENENCNKSYFNIFEVLLIVFVSILFGIVIGYVITNNKNLENEKINEIINTYNNLRENYYSKVDDDKLVDSAIKGMIDSLEDPYSNYMDLTTTDDFNESIDGAFVGIGITVVFSDNYNKVVEVLKNSPAEKGGVKVGDIILEVDNIDASGLSGDELTKLIRGREGTKVRLLVKSNDLEKSIILKRDKIEVQTVYSEVLEYNENKIGYLNLISFAANTSSQFESEIKKLEKKEIKSLIIDVRDNPGGHLLQAKEILSMFFDKKTVLYQIESKNNKKKIYSLNNSKKTYPLVILINKKSASASEILASSIQDNYKKSLIIGENSYGKGTVQKSKNLSDGTSIKFTTQKWLTAKGVWINKKGVKPDIEVKLDENYFKNPTQENDSQLQEALKRIIELL